MTIIRKEGKEEGDSEHWQEHGETGGPPNALLAKMYNDAAAVGNDVAVSQKKLNIESPDNPAIPLLGIYPQRTESMDSDRYLHTHIHSCIIHKKPSPSGLHKPNPSNSVKSFQK